MCVNRTICLHCILKVKDDILDASNTVIQVEHGEKTKYH